MNIFKSKEKELFTSEMRGADVSEMNNIIAQIHNEFDNASDFVLKQAQDILNKACIKDFSSGERLSKLGFKKTAKAVAFSTVDAEIKLSTMQIDKVNEIKSKYPDYKYIPADIVGIICKKYNLVCGKADTYTGDVPEKNLLELESFDKMITEKVNDIYNREVENGRGVYGNSHHVYEYAYERGGKKYDYYICAPKSDMDLNDKEAKEGWFYADKPIPDPIVLYPVNSKYDSYNYTYIPEGFLIVTKWGLEQNISELRGK